MKGVSSAETLFSSETKIQIIRTLSLNPQSMYSVDLLEEVCTAKAPAIYKALEDLREEEAVEVMKTEGKKYKYRLNNGSRVGEVLKNYFRYEADEISQAPTHVLNIVFGFRKRLITKLGDLDKVILFGSAVRGEYGLESDIDLYIVCEEMDTDKEDKIYEISENYDHEFSLIMRSRERFQEDFQKPLSNLAQGILEDCYICLYGDLEDEIIKDLRIT